MRTPRSRTSYWPKKQDKTTMQPIVRTLTLTGALLGTTLMASVPTHAETRDVTIDGGLAPLAGTLVMPDGTQPVPGVLLIAGSGPTDRNGNQLPGVAAATLELLAEGLAGNGIASLRFDKRGVGASAAAAGPQEETTFETFVDDAVSWAQFLSEQAGIECVYLIGHSEGALIAALAAQQVDVCGVVSISGAGSPIGEVIRRQLQAQADAGALPEALLIEANSILDRLGAAELVPDPPEALAPLFHPSVQPFLISWMAIDPVTAIAAADAPVLVMQGTTDIQVGVDQAELLAAARPGTQLIILDGVNHVLKVAPPDMAANVATYADPDLPLAPGVIDAIVEFIRSQ